MAKIIAIKERSAGNETVGDMWLETKIFEEFTPIGDVAFWGNSLSIQGKLIITLEHEIKKNDIVDPFK